MALAVLITVNTYTFRIGKMAGMFITRSRTNGSGQSGSAYCLPPAGAFFRLSLLSAINLHRRYAFVLHPGGKQTFTDGTISHADIAVTSGGPVRTVISGDSGKTGGAVYYAHRLSLEDYICTYRFLRVRVCASAWRNTCMRAGGSCVVGVCVCVRVSIGRLC